MVRVGWLVAFACSAAVLGHGPAPLVASSVEAVRPTGALPANLVSTFLDPASFVETSTGEAIVLDHRASAVYGIDPTRESVHRLLRAGTDPTGLLRPTALALGPDDLFAVADELGGVDRIQYFTVTGVRVGGFYLPDRPQVHVSVNGVALNGVGSLQFADKSFFVNLPSRGRLISELNADGQTVRQFGLLRPTGQGPDPDLEMLLNVGVPLVDPTGGFYFVFQTGVPMFRKYTTAGDLLFERHIEGPELDGAIQSLPTVWPSHLTDGRIPFVNPLVRTAAVDRHGRLWVALNLPYVYVYDPAGSKIRTVQLTGTGPLVVRSLFFTARDRMLVTPGCYEFAVQ